MAIDVLWRHVADAFKRLGIRRPRAAIELVAWRPLHGGAVLYVAEFDRRRHLFVVAQNAACLLASYSAADIPQAHPDGSPAPVRLK